MGLVKKVLDIVKRRNPNEPEFLQAVTEVLESIEPAVQRHKKYRDGKILERIVEPERVIQFRVPWIDDKGQIQVNRGLDRKSTRLNSSHSQISYAVFCL